MPWGFFMHNCQGICTGKLTLGFMQRENCHGFYPRNLARDLCKRRFSMGLVQKREIVGFMQKGDLSCSLSRRFDLRFMQLD